MSRLPRLQSSNLAIGAAAVFVALASGLALMAPRDEVLGRDWALRGTLASGGADPAAVSFRQAGL